MEGTPVHMGCGPRGASGMVEERGQYSGCDNWVATVTTVGGMIQVMGCFRKSTQNDQPTTHLVCKRTTPQSPCPS